MDELKDLIGEEEDRTYINEEIRGQKIYTERGDGLEITGDLKGIFINVSIPLVKSNLENLESVLTFTRNYHTGKVKEFGDGGAHITVPKDLIGEEVAIVPMEED